jgi:hypothetical protein
MVFEVVGGFGTWFHLMTLGFDYFILTLESIPPLMHILLGRPFFGPWIKESWLFAHGSMPWHII